jgi:hypothetical protein
MKMIASLAALLVAAWVAPAGAVGFTGAQAAANWTVTNTGTLLGGSPTLGTAVFSPTQLVLTGSNSLSPDSSSLASSCAGGSYATLGPCRVQATINVGGLYSFSWSYLSSDEAGPAGDIFGVIVDANRIQLSNPGGAPAQSGASSFAASSSFGFFIDCTDCITGSATATISNFAVAAPIPEPETYALIMAGLALVSAAARRRKKHS